MVLKATHNYQNSASRCETSSLAYLKKCDIFSQNGRLSVEMQTQVRNKSHPTAWPPSCTDAAERGTRLQLVDLPHPRLQLLNFRPPPHLRRAVACHDPGGGGRRPFCRRFLPGITVVRSLGSHDQGDVYIGPFFLLDLFQATTGTETSDVMTSTSATSGPLPTRGVRGTPDAPRATC